MAVAARSQEHRHHLRPLRRAGRRRSGGLPGVRVRRRADAARDAREEARVGPRLLAQGRVQRHRAPVQCAGLRARRDGARRADARLGDGQLRRARQADRLRAGAHAQAARQLPRASGRRDDGGAGAGDDGAPGGGRRARRHLLGRRHPVRAAHRAHAGRFVRAAERGRAGRAAGGRSRRRDVPASRRPTSATPTRRRSRTRCSRRWPPISRDRTRRRPPPSRCPPGSGRIRRA